MCRLLKQIIPASISFDLGFRNSLWQRHFPECAHTYFLKPNYREKQFCAKVTKTSSSVVSIASRLLYKALSVGLECSSLIWIVIFWNGIFRCLFKEMPFLWRYSLWPGAYQWGNVVMDCEWDGERQELSISWCSSLLCITAAPQRSRVKYSEMPFYLKHQVSHHVPFKIPVNCLDLN